MQDVLKTVAIADITVSATNPRRHFDENALAELAKSVAQYGVMTPILLRPVKKGYELVCGERRYRASKMAGKTEIPANIRKLTDDEAFELQIIENLERKEVHPLDEAEAFRRMLDSGRYQIADIAAKLAKPETFVVQRLKLNDLIEEIKKDFFDGELNIGQAVLIARLEPDAQQEIRDGFKGQKADGYGTVKQLEAEINNKTIALDTASFSTKALYGTIQACDQCHKRTAVNPALFPDLQEVDCCMDKTCFRVKTETALIEKITGLVAEGSEVRLAKTFSGEPAASVKALAQEYGLPILKEHSDFYPTDNGGTQIEVLYVVGNYTGVSKVVWVKKAPAVTGSGAGTSSGSGGEYTKLQQLKEKKQRDLDLDEQKVHAKIREALDSEFSKMQPMPFTCHDNDADVFLLYLAMLHSPIYHVSWVFQKMGYEMQREYKTVEDLVKDFSAFTDEQKKQMLFVLLYRACKESSTGKTLHGQIIRWLADGHPNIDVTAIQQSQDEIAAVRIQGTDKKIAELEQAESNNDKNKK
ncbi:ParB/RepB/Spo0J family partition protein [Flavobacterium sp. RHBU_3]|uniref:ParB/RepB/Spo0J family partition protein n=1 Tax=Flavobacterium sp. RHBU_3 TaxID=3391184 RepID=UPI003984A346